jgi:hypothetical protein
MNDSQPSPQPAAAAQLCAKLEGIEKVVVAIHGIGSQTRGSTVREVVRQFGDRQKKKLPLMPLGFFHIDPAFSTLVSRLSNDPGDSLSKIGFVEVFWADIPRGIVQKEDTLEETKAWGRTIVSRAQALYESKTTQAGTKLVPADFTLAAGVVEEVVEAMAVLENLCTLSDKAGIFRFDLASLLRDYVDDVQVVTEFEPFRREIVLCFHKIMAGIERAFRNCNYPLPEIHIVAHSEGTVVSFLGLLEALSGLPIPDPDAGSGQPATISTGWIERVRGYMTIGSPIDKHLVLWPRLWDQVRGKLKLGGPPRIKWRNYYDHGDPIGFKLDTAREFLREQQCAIFEFDGDKHDFGFSRYPLPGKAHNDYWKDADVFGHFIDDVVSPAKEPSEPPKPPQNKPWPRTVSLALPYVIVFALHVGAVYALFKGISAFFKIPPELSAVALQLVALGAFFNTVTIAARLPRLTKAIAPRLRGLTTLVLLGGFAILCLGSAATYVGEAIARVVKLPADSLQTAGQLTIALIGVIVVLTGWLAPRKPRWGRRLLITVGGLLVVGIVAINWLYGKTSGEPLWPAILGSAGFIYLWWLGILLFDLTFIWHRYVRQAVAIQSLRRWSHYTPDPQ